MLTWREAAISALKDAGPLRVDQITQRIQALGLRDLTGNTPEATVGVQLYLAVQNNDSRVRLVAPSVFEHTGSDDVQRSERSLGRLEFINPREVWSDEARHFTPWLLENASYLSEVLGLDLELHRSEHPIGPFSLDLFGEDLTHGCPLIVENQLEETDHKHLGQLLTYAAGTDALTVVWVSPKFRNEHRDALAYLNQISTGEARFFGVELRVAVIGDSDPAPHFTLTAQPSDWRAQVRQQRVAGQSSEKAASYAEFWTELVDRLHERHPGVTTFRATNPYNWLRFSSLRRLAFVAAFGANSEVRCEVYIDVGDADANTRLFNALKEHRSDIESQIGHPLTWDPIDGKRACRISSSIPGSIHDDDKEPLLDWIEAEHLRFRDTFRPIIQLLPSSLWTGDGLDD